MTALDFERTARAAFNFFVTSAAKGQITNQQLARKLWVLSKRIKEERAKVGPSLVLSQEQIDQMKRGSHLVVPFDESELIIKAIEL